MMVALGGSALGFRGFHGYGILRRGCCVTEDGESNRDDAILTTQVDQDSGEGRQGWRYAPSGLSLLLSFPWISHPSPHPPPPLDALVDVSISPP